MTDPASNPNTPIRGHAIADGGAPHDDNGNRVSPNSWGGVGGSGRARCECGVLSDVLPSAARRRAWHRDHKASIRSATT